MSAAPDWCVVEVGSGPVGQLGFLPAQERHAFDPLMDVFEQQPALVRARPDGVRYRQAKGEELPMESGSADLVILDNCIDHCQSPADVLAEIRRILKRDGILYLTVNVRSLPGWAVRTGLEYFWAADPGHPFSYYPALVARTVRRSGFAQLESWTQSWLDSIRENAGRGWLRVSAKLATLTLERLYEGVWRRSG